MITNFLISILYYIVALITSPLRLFSDYSVPADVNSSLATAANYMAILNSIIPLTTLLGIFGIVLVFEGFIVTYRIIRWLYQKIPTIN